MSTQSGASAGGTTFASSDPMLFMWWFWIAMLLLLFLIPLGYGWGYRGWGPPYPSRWPRRRATAGGAEVAPGWGFGADLLWIVFFFMLAWLVALLIV